MRTDEFRALHRPGQPLVLPNAWDFASAAALVEAGFAAVGTTSLGVAAALGVPDGHGRTRTATLDLTRILARLPCLLSVDAEAGFSDDPAEVADLAAELANLGAVGINLEDGRPDATLAPIDAQVALLRAVKSRVPELFVNARVDAYWVGGTDPQVRPEAIARARAYQEAGADGVFVPGLVDPGGIAAVVDSVAVPVNILYSPSGPTVRDLAELGVARVST